MIFKDNLHISENGQKFIAGKFLEQNQTIIFILVASLTYPEVIKNKIYNYFGCIGKKKNKLNNCYATHNAQCLQNSKKVYGKKVLNNTFCQN